MGVKQTYFFKVAFVLYHFPKAFFWRCVLYWRPRSEMIRCLLAALKARRLTNKPYDIGLGPLPLINNVYHKQALTKYGYKTNTFVYNVYHITAEFDFNADKQFTEHQKRKRYYSTWFKYVVNNHKCLYIYFNGCVLGGSPYLSKYEAFLLKLARVKVVLMPYGADVQDLSKTTNLQFKNAICHDYPKFHLQRNTVRRNIEMWTTHGDHIIAGNDWIEYLYHWDTLLLAHFSIDVERCKPTKEYNPDPKQPLRIFHAPNHKTIKGSKHFIRAVNELKREGLNIELILMEKAPNEEVLKAIEEVDVVADQLIIGWYAMFSLEAMSYAKPVLCYINPAFEKLYIEAGLLEPGELPIVRCDPFNVKEKIKELYENRSALKDIGIRSREHVIKHHSTDYIGSVFDQINKKIGLTPSLAAQ